MGAVGIIVRACVPPAPITAAALAPSGSRDTAQARRRSKPLRTGRVAMLGLSGTGCVGGSMATSLSRLRPDLDILVGGSYHRCAGEQPFLLRMKQIDAIYRCCCPILI
jgi:hypothetical protein